MLQKEMIFQQYGISHLQETFSIFFENQGAENRRFVKSCPGGRPGISDGFSALVRIHAVKIDFPFGFAGSDAGGIIQEINKGQGNFHRPSFILIIPPEMV